MPQQIGPYRVDGLLGQGGMGAVYRAWDQRLQRRVALKFLHADQHSDSEQLLNEARMIATLNHPHVMQIYDTVQTGDPADGQTVLVLEWIEGINLLQLQGQRPLPVLQVYHYARQILSGLAAAHRLGVIHGDLKAENIMVNSEGQIKILDFGLARARGGHGTDECAINTKAGTCRCMSPEQINGGDIDSRADLFACGVLFYEMLSGHSPFLREDAKTTLEAVCHEVPPRLDELDPTITPALAGLVQQLLAKDPAQRQAGAELVLLELDALREGITRQAHNNPTLSRDQATLQAPPLPPGGTPSNWPTNQPTQPGTPAAAGNHSWPAGTQWPPGASWPGSGVPPSTYPAPRQPWLNPRQTWALITLAAATLLTLAFFYWRGSVPAGPPAPRYVAIAPPTISGIANSEQSATLGAALNLAARQELENRQGLVVVPGDIVNEVAGGEHATDEQALGAITGADEVVRTGLVCAGNECNAHVERLDHNQQRLWSRSFTSPPEAPLLYRALRIHLQEAYAALPARRSGVPAVSATDLDRLLWLQGEFERNEMQHMNSEEMLTRVDDLLASSPAFEEAHLLRARILLYRYHQEANPEDLNQARAAVEQVDTSPGSSAVSFEIAMAQNDLDSAERALEQYAGLQPGSASILAMRSRLAERRGETSRALVLMQEAAQRQPSWRHWFWAADMAYRQGETARARKDLEALLGLVPEHYAGLSLLAEIEMQDGRLNAAEAIYRRLVLRSPQLTELSNLGTVYLFLGQYQQAVDSFRRALELAPENPFVRLNLADALKLNNETISAEQHYRSVLEQLGDAGNDPDLLGALAQAQAHLGEHSAARDNVAQLLATAQHQPQALYTAAVVFTVLNDSKLARHYRQLAQQAGIDAIWFSLPWFE